MSEDIYIEEIWREMGKLKSESRSLVAEAQAEIKELKDRIEDLEAALLIPHKGFNLGGKKEKKVKTNDEED